MVLVHFHTWLCEKWPLNLLDHSFATKAQPINTLRQLEPLRQNCSGMPRRNEQAAVGEEEEMERQGLLTAQSEPAASPAEATSTSAAALHRVASGNEKQQVPSAAPSPSSVVIPVAMDKQRSTSLASPSGGGDAKATLASVGSMAGLSICRICLVSLGFA